MNLSPFQSTIKSKWLSAVGVVCIETCCFASQVLSGHLNNAGEIVVVSLGANLGIQLQSDSQSLVPVPPGDLTADPSPYQFFLQNNQDSVSWGNIGFTTHLEGSFNTGVRLSDGDVSSVTGAYGDGLPLFFPVFETPPPEVTATFDVGGGLAIHGNVPDLTRVAVETERTQPKAGKLFDVEWFDDLPGLDGSLSLPFRSSIYPVSEDFNLVAIYCQEDGNCREIEFVTEFTCDPNTFGDFNSDGQVGFADFLIIAFNFGKEVPDHNYGDADCNGRVEFADFLVNSSCFGCNTVGAQPVPEPSSAFLMLFVSLSMIHAIRRAKRDGYSPF